MTRASIRTQFDNRDLVAVVLRHDEILNELLKLNENTSLLTQFITIAQQVISGGYLRSRDDAVILGDWAFSGQIIRTAPDPPQWNDLAFITKHDYDTWTNPLINKINLIDEITGRNFQYVLWCSNTDGSECPPQTVVGKIMFSKDVVFAQRPTVNGAPLALELDRNEFVTIGTEQVIRANKLFDCLLRAVDLCVDEHFETHGNFLVNRRPRLLGKYNTTTQIYNFGNDPETTHEPAPQHITEVTAATDLIDHHYFITHAVTGASLLTVTQTWKFNRLPVHMVDGVSYDFVTLNNLTSFMWDTFGLRPYTAIYSVYGVEFKGDVNGNERKVQIYGGQAPIFYYNSDPQGIGLGYCGSVTLQRIVKGKWYMGFATRLDQLVSEQGGDTANVFFHSMLTTCGNLDEKSNNKEYRTVLHSTLVPDNHTATLDSQLRRVLPLEFITKLGLDPQYSTEWVTRIGRAINYYHQPDNNNNNQHYTSFISRISKNEAKHQVALFEAASPIQDGGMLNYDIIFNYAGVGLSGETTESLAKAKPNLKLMSLSMKENLPTCSLSYDLLRGEYPENIVFNGPGVNTLKWWSPYIEITRTYKDNEGGYERSRRLKLSTKDSGRSEVTLEDLCNPQTSKYNLKFNARYFTGNYNVTIPPIYNSDLDHRILEGGMTELCRTIRVTNKIETTDEDINRSSVGSYGGFSILEGASVDEARLLFTPLVWIYQDTIKRKRFKHHEFGRTVQKVNRDTYLAVGRWAISHHDEGRVWVVDERGRPYFGTLNDNVNFIWQIAALKFEPTEKQPGVNADYGKTRLAVFETHQYNPNNNEDENKTVGAIEVDMNQFIAQSASIRVHSVIKDIKLYKGKKVVSWTKRKTQK